MRSKRAPAAVRPIRAGSWATTVTGGSSRSASGKSSKPTSATDRCRPSRRSARTAPTVIRFRPVKIAVGGSGTAQHRQGGAFGGGGVAQVVHHRAGAPAERPQITPVPVARRRETALVAEVRDPPVPVRDQVPDRPGRPGHVCRTRTVSPATPVAGRSTKTTGMSAQSRRGRTGRRRSARGSGRRSAARAKAYASSRSRSASSSRLPVSTWRPRARASSSTARCSAAENGFGDVLEQHADGPGAAVVAAQHARAEVRAVVQRRDRGPHPGGQTGATVVSPFTTRETVLRLTPAVRATSFMVGRAAPSGRLPSMSITERNEPETYC